MEDSTYCVFLDPLIAYIKKNLLLALNFLKKNVLIWFSLCQFLKTYFI